jgi:multiple sugar transport system substrate-binding protein
VFAYRIDVLEEAGIAVPTTWDELAEAARALTVRDDSGEITFSGFCFPSTGGNLVELDVFVYGNGGSYIAEDGGPLMTGVEKEEVIDFLNGLLPDVNIPYSNGETNPFAKGLAAMTLMNNAALTSVINNPEFDGEIGIALPPHNEGHDGATFCGCNMLFIGRDCADKDAAWKYIAFAMSPESTLKRSEIVNIPVTRQSLVEEYQAMDPWNGVRAECVAVGTGMPRTLWSTQFQKIRNELVQNVVLGNVTDPAAALEKAQDDLLFEIDG